MSQFASFARLNITDVPHLGFWSKPKPRLFRKAENQFDQFLKRHVVEESNYEGDGASVALAFAWFQSNIAKAFCSPDPVLATLRAQLEGSHWLLKHPDCLYISDSKLVPKKEDWRAFSENVVAGGVDSTSFEDFYDAWQFSKDRISAVQKNEALLVSIG